MRSASLSVIALLAMLACTPRGSQLELDGAEPVKPVAERPSSAPEPSPRGNAPVPGFVLYTAEQTILVPTDGSPYLVGEGLWLQDDRVSPPALSHALIMSESRSAIMDMPRCPCLALAGACEDDSVESRRFDPQTGTLVSGPEQPCACMRLQESLAFLAAEIDGVQYEGCKTDEEQVISSLIAGWLLYQGWEWNGACFHGESAYDGTSFNHALIDEPPKISSDGMRSVGCRELELPYAAADRSWPIERGSLHECDEHEPYESEVFLLRRGDLWEVRDAVGGGGSVRWYLKRPARPHSCPSVNDPCGDPAPYRDRAQLNRRQREFWIATDGGAALTAERHSYSLWSADADTSFDFELPDIDASTDVIGVRYHADLGPLRATIDEHPTLGRDRPGRAPTTLDADACLAQLGGGEPGSRAQSLGNACLRYIGLERWVDAEFTCLLGLAAAQQPGTRGAILYNLGLIAEAQGALEQASMYYRQSLTVRPNNHRVERELARLELP
ncbi:MAG TPA: tetratricopeptide repeat protein [Enhygromyxa sp.]|nr:tetratricopeptide repeat protein [Enhygromyxa sp.]